jgi:hypothetical protein
MSDSKNAPSPTGDISQPALIPLAADRCKSLEQTNTIPIIMTDVKMGNLVPTQSFTAPKTSMYYLQSQNNENIPKTACEPSVESDPPKKTYGSIDPTGEFYIHFDGGAGQLGFKADRWKMIEFLFANQASFSTPPDTFNREKAIADLKAHIKNCGMMTDGQLHEIHGMIATPSEQLAKYVSDALSDMNRLVNFSTHVKEATDVASSLENELENLELYSNFCTIDQKDIITKLRSIHKELSDIRKIAQLPTAPKPRYLPVGEYKMEINAGRRICGRRYKYGKLKDTYCSSTSVGSTGFDQSLSPEERRCNNCSWTTHGTRYVRMSFNAYLEELVDEHKICGYIPKTPLGNPIRICGADDVVDPDAKCPYEMRCETHRLMWNRENDFRQFVAELSPTADNLSRIRSMIPSAVRYVPVPPLPSLKMPLPLPMIGLPSSNPPLSGKVQVFRNESTPGVFWFNDEKWSHLALVEVEAEGYNIVCIGAFKTVKVTKNSEMPTGWEKQLTEATPDDLIWLKSQGIIYRSKN